MSLMQTYSSSLLLLWNVLVETTSQVRFPVHIIPREIIGQIVFFDVSVGKRGGVGFHHIVAFEHLTS